MLAETGTRPNRPRAWRSFSLKTILLLVLLVSVYFAGRVPLQQRVRQLEQERRQRQLEMADQRFSLRVRAARKRADVAMAEYEEGLQINRISPAALSEGEIARLKALWELAELQVEQAELPPESNR